MHTFFPQSESRQVGKFHFFLVHIDYLFLLYTANSSGMVVLNGFYIRNNDSGSIVQRLEPVWHELGKFDFMEKFHSVITFTNTEHIQDCTQVPSPA